MGLIVKSRVVQNVEFLTALYIKAILVRVVVVLVDQVVKAAVGLAVKAAAGLVVKAAAMAVKAAAMAVMILHRRKNLSTIRL